MYTYFIIAFLSRLRCEMERRKGFDEVTFFYNADRRFHVAGREGPSFPFRPLVRSIGVVFGLTPWWWWCADFFRLTLSHPSRSPEQDTPTPPPVVKSLNRTADGK